METLLSAGNLPSQVHARAGGDTTAIKALSAIERWQLEAGLRSVAAETSVAQVENGLLTVDNLAKMVARWPGAARLTKLF